MKSLYPLIVVIVLAAAYAGANDLPLRFERLRIGSGTYEAASAFDVDMDGHVDIVSGEYWHKGPDFLQSYRITEIRKVGDYYDDFSDYPMDVNGDGYLDIVTGGWWGAMLRWHENPKGGTGPWTVHDIDNTGSIETTRFWDVDGDGFVEAVPNAGGNVVAYRLVRDADGQGTGTFEKQVIRQGGCGHGLGFGDVNGDGRGDVIIPNGWLEAPPNPRTEEWVFHGEFDLGSASVPILVHDTDGDGLADLIWGAAHGYGLFRLQQGRGADGERTWTRHEIDTQRSQYHDLALADLDGDGVLELITGKRYRAHSGNDPGANDPVGLYYFEMNGDSFRRVTLDFGPATKASGAGIYFWVADVDGDKRPDIVAPGKEGLYVFLNRGTATP